MKKVLLIALATVSLAACGGGVKKDCGCMKNLNDEQKACVKKHKEANCKSEDKKACMKAAFTACKIPQPEGKKLAK